MSIPLAVAITTGLVSIIVALTALARVIVNGKEQKEDALDKDKKLEEIHVLVNSRLSEALDKISRLEVYIEKITGKTVEETDKESKK